jgi:hypothetical protein
MLWYVPGVAVCISIMQGGPSSSHGVACERLSYLACSRPVSGVRLPRSLPQLESYDTRFTLPTTRNGPPEQQLNTDAAAMGVAMARVYMKMELARAWYLCHGQMTRNRYQGLATQTATPPLPLCRDIITCLVHVAWGHVINADQC